jgi:tetratricopeptide (TPR) repeat protein
MPLKKTAKRHATSAKEIPKPVPGASAGGSARETRAKPGPLAKPQPDLFDEAIRAQHSGEFERARSLFEEASKGSNREMAHAARIHARMCEHRMSRSDPVLQSAEDHYNFAVTLMNQRSLEPAEQHLRTALQMVTDGDHLHYALALCRGLRGDLEEARKHLQRAIELQPKNRLMARNDPDFIELSRNRLLAQLLYPEGTS